MAAAEPRPVVVTFRRGEFFNDFQDTKPKWHLLKGDEPGKWGTFVAYCGYTRSNILGDLRISRSKTPKRAAETCGRCVAALGKEQKNARR